MSEHGEEGSGLPRLPPEAGAGASGRLHLAIAFCDLSDSTRLGNQLEAEVYADLLADLRRLYRDVIPRHGGTIVRIQGDGMLAVFGYPQTREDDGRRATAAALELHQAVRELDVRGERGERLKLSLHSGVHAGIVLVDAGDALRGRLELVGTVPNLAAHLAGQAGADEILVSESTLGADRHFFQAGPERRLLLKSHPEPITALPILGHAAVATRLEARNRRGATPFVGRADDFEALTTALARAQTGEARCLVLRAPPGLGKTRLAEEFLRHAASAGWQIARGYCEAYLGAGLLQPFVQILRTLCPPEQAAADAADAFDAHLLALDPALAAHGAALQALLGGPEAPGSGSEAPDRIAAALQALVLALARRQPLVLFIDDVQWADDVTRQALARLVAIREARLLLLCATRPDPAHEADWPAAALRDLAPLADAAVDAALARLLPEADPILAGRIRQHAGGNALYLEELCHSAAQDSRLQDLDHAPAGGAWLDALVASRVGRLAPAARDVLRAASVLGTVLPLWLLRALAGPAASDERLQELEQQDFLHVVPGQGAVAWLRFKHGLTRDVIYAAIGLHERRAMHLRAAIVLRERSDDLPDRAEALAYHYGAGNSPAEAAQYAELAGERALRAGALDRAQQQFRAALMALDPDSGDPAVTARWMAIARRLGMACVFDPSRSHLDLLQRAATLAAQRQDHVAAAEAQYWLGYITYALGDVRPAARACQRALDFLAPGANDRLAVQIRATLGQALAAAGRHAPALALFDAALGIKASHRSGSNPSVGLAYTMACKAAVLADHGRFDEAQSLFDQALAAVAGANHQVEASVLGWRCLAHLWRGEWAPALEAARAASRMGEHFRSRYILAMNQGLGARARWEGGTDADALHDLATATRRLEAGDRRLCLSLNHAWLAEAAWRQGRGEEARLHVSRAIRRARAGDSLGLASAWRTLALCDPARSARWLARAYAVARWRDSPHEQARTHEVAALVAARAGQPAQARALEAEAGALFERLGMRPGRGEGDASGAGG